MRLYYSVDSGGMTVITLAHGSESADSISWGEPVSVLTFDSFQQRTEGEAERLKAGPAKT
jgi:hypothetical protein